VQREIVELQALLPGEAVEAVGIISAQLESIVHSAHSELDLGIADRLCNLTLELALRYRRADDRSRLRVQRGGNTRLPLVPDVRDCTHNRCDSVWDRGARVDCSVTHDGRFSAASIMNSYWAR